MEEVYAVMDTAMDCDMVSANVGGADVLMWVPWNTQFESSGSTTGSDTRFDG